MLKGQYSHECVWGESSRGGSYREDFDTPGLSSMFWDYTRVFYPFEMVGNTPKGGVQDRVVFKLKLV